MAELYFKYGAMGSGKSSLLIQMAYNYNKVGKRVVVIKPSLDNRADNKVVSRTGMECQIDYEMNDTDSFYTRLDLNNIDCIIVDEAQFLTESQVKELSDITIDYNIPVMCYGLLTDFRVSMFPGSKRLMELASVRQEIGSICEECGKDAVRNARFKDGEFTISGDQVSVDNEEAREEQNIIYKGLCRECYRKHERQLEEKQKILTLGIKK